MANPLTPRELLEAAREVAGQFNCARPAFRQFYDTVVSSLGRREVPRSFMAALVVATRRIGDQGIDRPLDPATDRDAFTLALFGLGSREALIDVAMAAVTEGLCDPPRADDAERNAKRQQAAAAIRATAGYEGAGLMPPPPPPTPGVGLQPQRGEAITDPNSTWTSPQALYPGVLLAIRRLCRVTTFDADNRPVTGTGFLIGPSAVLTNWHVIEDATRRQTPRIQVFFDHVRPGVRVAAQEKYEVEDRWLLSSSEMGLEKPDGAQNSWWMHKAARTEWQALLADSLDFAVIALKGAPGRRRGWYDLRSLPPATTDGSCWGFHHPAGQGQTVTAGSFVFVDGAEPVRAFHNISTLGGSSGGLILDGSGLPVALHQGAFGETKVRPDGTWPQVPQEAINVAIPLAAIASRIGKEPLDALQREGRFSFARGCLDGRHPVFGRANLLSAIESLADGKHRVLWVKPPEAGAKKKLGKTFSVEVLKALLPPPANVFVELTADQVKSGGRDMAKFILDKLAPPTPVNLPQPEDGGTTETAYFENHLVTVLRDTIASEFAANTIWLVIDDLDIHNLLDAGGRRFLDVLYKRVADIPQLRIVLVGLKVALPSIPAPILWPSPIEPELGDLAKIPKIFEDWLLLRARNGPIDLKVLTMLSRVAAGFAGDEAPLEGLARFAIQYLDKPLTDLLEE